MVVVDPRPFVGRERELAALDSAVADLERGIGRVVTICGEPGIGKSQLAGELCRRVAGNGHVVIRGRAAEFERDVAFAVIVDAFEPFFRSLDERDLGRLSGDRIAALAPVIPALAGFADRASTALRVERYRLHHAARGILEEVAAGSPVVLVIDDLQWADEASLELLAHLMLRRPDGPVLVVFVYRGPRPPRGLDSAVAAAFREDVVTALELAPLPRAQVDQLIGDDLTPDVRQAIHRASGGNPFYVQELARAARMTDGRRPAGEQRAEAPDLGVPQLVAIAIADELRELSESARRLAYAAAVAWEPFDLTLAAWVAGIDEEVAGRALDELAGTGVVRVARSDAAYNELTGPLRFVFRHPVVRHAVYESMGEGSRITAHGRVAEMFATRGAPAALFAHHIEQAAAVGDEEAARLLERAGQEVLARAPAAAARWFASALHVVGDGADAARRLGLLEPLATALWLSGRIVECRGRLEQALELVRPELDAERLRLLSMMVRVDRMLGEHARARALLTDALAEVGDDDEAVCGLHLELAVDCWRGRECDRVLASAGAAHDAAVRLEDRTLVGFSAALVALAQIEIGATSSAVARVEEAASLVEALPDEALAEHVELLTYLGCALVGLGRHQAAASLLERGIAITRATGQDVFFVAMVTELAEAQTWLGDLAGAAESVEAAIGASSLLPDEHSRAGALLARGILALRRGQLPVAVQVCSDAVTAAQGSALLEPLAKAWLGSAQIEAGALDEGRERIHAQVGGSDRAVIGAHLRPYFQARVAEVDLALGFTDRAERWVVTVEQQAAQIQLPARIADARLARAAWCLARNDAAAAADAAGDAAALYGSIGQMIDVARAETINGRALAAAGERKRAIERLEHAYHALSERGAERYRDEAARELRALGRRVSTNGRNGRRAGQNGGPTKLSPRELSVAELVALGHTNRRIAGELFLSEKTVETYMSRIFDKLEVSSRAAIGRALEQRAAADRR